MRFGSFSFNVTWCVASLQCCKGQGRVMVNMQCLAANRTKHTGREGLSATSSIWLPGRQALMGWLWLWCWQKDRHPRLLTPSRHSRLLTCFRLGASRDRAKFSMHDLVAVHDDHVLVHANVAFMPAVLGTPLLLFICL